MNGKTIEVNNTDAEGRLVLADALCYAVEQGVEQVVDLATLTGAIVVALGSTYAGLLTNDEDWYADVDAAGDASGELGWRMPLHPDYLELTKGQFADLTNAAEARMAGSSYAAEFLRQFVGDTPWAHLDIAGTAWDTGRPYVGKGASGFGTRALIALARRTAGGRSPPNRGRSRPPGGCPARSCPPGSGSTRRPRARGGASRPSRRSRGPRARRSRRGCGPRGSPPAGSASGPSAAAPRPPPPAAGPRRAAPPRRPGAAPRSPPGASPAPCRPRARSLRSRTSRSR